MLRLLSRRTPTPPGRPAPCRPHLEQLEDRLTPSITYHGGPLLTNVQAFTVYYGDAWQNDPALYQQSQQLDGFFAYLTDSTYLDMLGEYGVGRGSFLGRVNTPLAQPANPDGSPGAVTVTDQDLQDMLDAAIHDPNSGMPAPNANTLYLVFTPPGVSNQYAVDNNVYAYHGSFTDSDGAPVYYAYVPCPADDAGADTFATMTEAATHELAEATTDPDGGGWFDPAYNGEGEIGDLANGVDGTLNGYVVQSVWSEAQQQPVLPYDATWSDPSIGTSLASENGPVPANLGLVAYALTHSDEYYANVVTTAYQTYLGRDPDGPGLEAWVSALRNGLTDERLEAGFLGSPEYIAGHGGTWQTWVESMYQDLLGRDPSRAELAGWVDALAAGASPQQVAYGFAAGAEREGLRVRADYRQFLGRDASPDEVAGWVDAFEHGVTNEDVVAGFVGSTENFRQHDANAVLWLEGAYQDVLGHPADPAGLQAWLDFLG